VNELVWKEKYEQLLPKYDEAQRKIGELLAAIGQPREHEKKLEEEKKRLETELANVKFLSEKDSKQVQQLLTEKSELLERIGKLEKDLEQFKTEHEALENLRKFLIPAGPPELEPKASVPSEVVVQSEIPSLTVHVVRKPLVLSTDNAQGRATLLYAEGFFDEEERSIGAVQKEMIRRGWPKDPRLSGFLDEMCSWGFLRKRRTDRWLYKAAMKSSEAREKGLLKEAEV